MLATLGLERNSNLYGSAGYMSPSHHSLVSRGAGTWIQLLGHLGRVRLGKNPTRPIQCFVTFMSECVVGIDVLCTCVVLFPKCQRRFFWLGRVAHKEVLMPLRLHSLSYLSTGLIILPIGACDKGKQPPPGGAPWGFGLSLNKAPYQGYHIYPVRKAPISLLLSSCWNWMPDWQRPWDARPDIPIWGVGQLGLNDYRGGQDSISLAFKWKWYI